MSHIIKFLKFIGRLIVALLKWVNRKLVKNPSKILFSFFGSFIAILLCWILYQIFGPVGSQIRASRFVSTIDYNSYTTPRRGNIYASDGSIISMEVPNYKLSLDFQADALFDTKVSKYKEPEVYQRKVDSLDELLEIELDTLSYLICNKTDIGRRYKLNRAKLRRSWKKGKLRRNKEGKLANREIPILAFKSRYNPKIDWATYQELKQYPPFKPVHTIRKIKTEDGEKEIVLKHNLISRIHTNSVNSLFERSYPFDNLANATIGTCLPDRDSIFQSHGRSGLELAQDSILSGVSGRKHITSSCGVKLKEDSVRACRDGYNIYTTLDMNMQNIVHYELEAQLEKYNAFGGHAILLDVKTGAIKAMVNLDRKYINGKRVYVEELNHCVQDRNEPGSSIKIASMLIALEDGVVSIDDEFDTGSTAVYYYNKNPIKDWDVFHKIKTPDIIKKSSNIGIAKLITKNYWLNYSTKKEQDASYDDYVAKLRKLFYYDMDLPLPNVSYPYIRTKKEWGRGYSALALSSMSYGYGLDLPSIYIVNLYNAIANGGKMMKPYLIAKVTKNDEEGNEEVVEETKPQVVAESIASEETIKNLQAMLKSVVSTEHQATAKKAYSKEVSLSGKTATAYAINPETGHYYTREDPVRYRVSFTSYFPSEDPQYTCFLLLDRCDQRLGLAVGGGATAAPVVLNIAKKLMRLTKKETLEGEKVEDMVANVEVKQSDLDSRIKKDLMPNFIGLNASQVMYLAQKQGYDVSFVGTGLVESQSITAGKSAKRGSKVRLILK